MQSGVGRTGPVWAIEASEVEPDLLLSGKSLGGGLPLAAVTGRADVMDAVEPGGLGGTFGGNPVACAAGIAVLDEVATDGFSRASRGDRRQAAWAPGSARRARCPRSARSGAWGRCSRSSSSATRETKEPAPSSRSPPRRRARERGLILLSCGLYGNVVRILVPLVASDEELDRGLDLLEESLGEACRGQ